MHFWILWQSLMERSVIGRGMYKMMLHIPKVHCHLNTGLMCFQSSCVGIFGCLVSWIELMLLYNLFFWSKLMSLVDFLWDFLCFLLALVSIVWSLRWTTGVEKGKLLMKINFPRSRICLKSTLILMLHGEINASKGLHYRLHTLVLSYLKVVAFYISDSPECISWAHTGAKICVSCSLFFLYPEWGR